MQSWFVIYPGVVLGAHAHIEPFVILASLLQDVRLETCSRTLGKGRSFARTR